MSNKTAIPNKNYYSCEKYGLNWLVVLYYQLKKLVGRKREYECYARTIRLGKGYKGGIFCENQKWISRPRPSSTFLYVLDSNYNYRWFIAMGIKFVSFIDVRNICVSSRICKRYYGT